MANTARLNLPLVAADQAQKHITHNEALTLIDGVMQLSVADIGTLSPPPSPALGDAHIVGAGPSGDWVGQGGALALWTDGGWRFSAPTEGWIAWNRADSSAYVFSSGSWVSLAETVSSFQNLAQLGVNATADPTNKLTVRSNAAAFNSLEAGAGGTGDVRVTVNREAGADTASFVFQTGFSARAEIGLPGSDDFTFKVSPDGSTFHNAMHIKSASGFVGFDKVFGSTPTFPTIAAGVLTIESGYVVPAPESGVADMIDTIAGGFDGALLVVTGTGGITLTFNDGTGNLKLGANRVLDNFEDSLLLVQRGGDWIELSFANNG